METIKKNSDKAGWPLIQRDNVIVQMDNLLKSGKTASSKCYLFHGKLGTGKTFCMEHFIHNYLEPMENDLKYPTFIYYDFETYKDKQSIPEILDQWEYLIKLKDSKNWFKFSRYNIVRERIKKLSGNNSNFFLKGGATNFLIKGGISVAAALDPGIATAVAISEIGKGIYNWSKDLSDAEYKEKVNNTFDFKILYKLLLMAFNWDVEVAMKYYEHPFCLFVDNYESYCSLNDIDTNRDNWIYELIENLSNCVFIIGDRDIPLWKNVNFVESQVYREDSVCNSEKYIKFEFENFYSESEKDKELLNSFFDEVKVDKDEEKRNLIISETGGHPLSVELSIKGNDVYKNVIKERSFRYIPDEYNKMLAYYLAFLERWTEESKEEYLGYFRLCGDLCYLKQAGLVDDNKMPRYIYNGLQDSVYQERLERICNYFEQKVVKLKSELEAKSKDESSQEAEDLAKQQEEQLDFYYHRYINCLFRLCNFEQVASEHMEAALNIIDQWFLELIVGYCENVEDKFIPMYRVILKESPIYARCELLWQLYNRINGSDNNIDEKRLQVSADILIQMTDEILDTMERYPYSVLACYSYLSNISQYDLIEKLVSKIEAVLINNQSYREEKDLGYLSLSAYYLMDYYSWKCIMVVKEEEEKIIQRARNLYSSISNELFEWDTIEKYSDFVIFNVFGFAFSYMFMCADEDVARKIHELWEKCNNSRDNQDLLDILQKDYLSNVGNVCFDTTDLVKDYYNKNIDIYRKKQIVNDNDEMIKMDIDYLRFIVNYLIILNCNGKQEEAIKIADSINNFGVNNKDEACKKEFYEIKLEKIKAFCEKKGNEVDEFICSEINNIISSNNRNDDYVVDIWDLYYYDEMLSHLMRHLEGLIEYESQLYESINNIKIAKNEKDWLDSLDSKDAKNWLDSFESKEEITLSDILQLITKFGLGIIDLLKESTIMNIKNYIIAIRPGSIDSKKEISRSDIKDILKQEVLTSADINSERVREYIIDVTREIRKLIKLVQPKCREALKNVCKANGVNYPNEIEDVLLIIKNIEKEKVIKELSVIKMRWIRIEEKNKLTKKLLKDLRN